MEGMIIKRTHDIELVNALHEQCFTGDKMYDHPTMVCWIAFYRKNPVGFCIASDAGYSTLFLARAGVLPGARKTGIHRRLVRVREAYAVRHGYKAIVTYVRPDNWSSWITLVKMGYQIYKPQTKWGTDDAFYFQKNVHLSIKKGGPKSPLPFPKKSK